MRRLLFSLLTAGPLVSQAASQQLPTLVRENRPAVLLPGVPSSAVSWMGDSALALADGDEQRVMLVDLQSGRVRAAAGRPGEGPGEYRGVNHPVPGPDGSLLVVDTRLRRATVLGPGLEVRRIVTLPVMVIATLRWTGSGLVGTWYDFTRQMTPVLGVLRFGPGEKAEPEPLVRLDSLFGAVSTDPFRLPPIVAAGLGAGGYFYAGKLDEYRILRLDPAGRPVRAFERRDLSRERYSAKEIEEQTGRVRGQSPVPVPPAAAARVREVLTNLVKPFFALNGLSEDGQGRLWVVTQRFDAGSTEIDVFAPGGKFLGTVRMRGLVRSLTWRGDRVAAVVERSEGEEHLGVVDVYRVR